MRLTIRPDVWKLTAPVLVEQFFVNLLSSLGAIMAARLGTEAVSAIGNVEAFTLVISSLFSALAIGATVIVAQSIGSGRHERAGAAARQALGSGLALALLIALGTALAGRPLLKLLYPDASPLLADHMWQYLMFSAATYPLTALTLLACGAQRGAGNTRLAMQVSSLVTALNVVLGYGLIYGFELHTGWFSVSVPRLEVAGAGLAQWLARLAGCACLAWLWQRDGLLFSWRDWRGFRPEIGLLRALYAIGIPASIESLAFNGGKLLVQVMVMTLGPAAVAANYVAFSVAGLMNIPGNALSVANTTLVGRDVGRGDEAAAARTMRHVLRLGWLVTAIIALCFAPLVPAVVGLYTAEPDVARQTCWLLWLNCAFLVVFPTTFILPNGLRGAGDAKFALLTTIIGMLLFRIGLGHVFGLMLGWGITGVWLGMFTDWLLRSALYVWRLRSGSWRGRAMTG
ncbi:MATE family efflux transporter [Uliginosibacterium paludis]|uniref:Multidrug-efflux transporter n=1 Tax=Uliginosibacterium paludis TaxID=1615952 RepID=A0ABV2CQ42_9RHOO